MNKDNDCNYQMILVFYFFIMPYKYFIIIVFCLMISNLNAEDVAQWGTVDQGRNRVSNEKNLPTTFLPGKKDATGESIVDAGPNVKWIARIGSKTYTPPVVVEGYVLIGTNNDTNIVPNVEGDQGVLACFGEKTGKLLWHYAQPKVTDIQHFDTAKIGLTSTPTVRNGRVYFVNNRGTVCVLELSTGKPIWTFDLITKLGVRQHDSNNCSLIVHEGLLYAGTANGLNAAHAEMERPEAPTLAIFDTETGRPLARDDDWLKTNISHGQWCSPALGHVEKKDGSREWTFFYCTGNGVVHAIACPNREELLKAAPKPEEIEPFGVNLPKLKPNWTFNGNGAEGVEPVNPLTFGRGSNLFVCLAPPVFADNRLYVLFCYDGTTGTRPHLVYLAAFDPSLPTETPKASRLFWKTPGIDKGTMCPLAVADGLLYFGDRNGGFYCIDIKTGETVWKLDLKGDHWAGALVADGKIYLGTSRRMFYVLQAGRTAEILSEIEMPEAMFAGAVAANETLFIPTDGFLYAIH